MNYHICYANCLPAGNLLLKQLLRAIPEVESACQDFALFDSGLCADIPEEMVAMEAEVKVWTQDKTQPDPYHVPKSGQ